MIICAALLVQVDGLSHTTIVPCHRHGDGFGILHDFAVKHKVLEQGFIDHKGNFLNRRDALDHARNCGQLPVTVGFYQEDNHLFELYSEDLY